MLLSSIFNPIIDHLRDWGKYPRLGHVSPVEMLQLSFDEASQPRGMASHLVRCEVCQAAFYGIAIAYHPDLSALAGYTIPGYGPTASAEEKRMKKIISEHLDNFRVCSQVVEYLKQKNELFRFKVYKEKPSAIKEVQDHINHYFYGRLPLHAFFVINH